MIVAITGGSGFIGAKLAKRHLAAGDRVRILTRNAGFALPGAEIFRSDLGDSSDGPAALASFVDGADLLYHCAWIVQNRAPTGPCHVAGTRRLLQASKGRIGRWVQLSTTAVYGGPFADEEIDEEGPTRPPQGHYEQAKAEADRLVLEAAHDGALRCSVLRPATVIGPEMPAVWLRQLVAAIERRRFFFIGKPGAAMNTIAVDNVVDALQLCATHPDAVGRIHNLCDWRSLESFVGAICAALELRPPALRCPAVLCSIATLVPGSPLTRTRLQALTNRRRYASRRLERELGYRHRVSVEQVLHQCVAQWKHDGP